MATKLLRRILVPIDGAEAADAAIDFALALANGAGELLFVHAINRIGVIASCSTPYGGVETGIALNALADAAHELLTCATTRAQRAGVPSSSAILDGDPIHEIVRIARALDVAAIVMGTHGRSGFSRLLLGSTAEGVLRRAEVPVFVLHAVPATTVLRTILVAIDPSEPAQSAARFAVDLAAENGARVVFCHVSDETKGEEDDGIAAAHGYAGTVAVSSETVRVAGTPAEAIVTSALSLRADLIALGTHGRGGIDELFFGSVARDVVRTSPLPVVALRDIQRGHREEDRRSDGARIAAPDQAVGHRKTALIR